MLYKTPYNEQGQRHGRWERDWFRGNYVNDVLLGFLEWTYAGLEFNENEYHAR